MGCLRLVLVTVSILFRDKSWELVLAVVEGEQTVSGALLGVRALELMLSPAEDEGNLGFGGQCTAR